LAPRAASRGGGDAIHELISERSSLSLAGVEPFKGAGAIHLAELLLEQRELALQPRAVARRLRQLRPERPHDVVSGHVTPRTDAAEQ